MGIQEKIEGIVEACATEDGATRKQIADALGLSKHPDLNDLIERVRQDGLIERGEFVARNKRLMFRYRVVGWRQSE